MSIYIVLALSALLLYLVLFFATAFDIAKKREKTVRMAINAGAFDVARDVMPKKEKGLFNRAIVMFFSRELSSQIESLK